MRCSVQTSRIGHPRFGRWWQTPTLAALVILLLWLAGCDTGGDQAATDGGPASPAATPSPAMARSPDQDTQTSGVNGGSGQLSEEQLSATVDEIVDQVAKVRGLQPQSEIDVELVSQQQIGDIVARVRQREIENRIIRADVLSALRFVPQGTDLAQLTEKMATAAVRGLYDPKADKLYVVADEGSLGPAERTATAHEIVHALQDQHFGLDRQLLAEGNPEAAAAFGYLAEGDAVAAQQQWVNSQLSTAEQQKLRRQSTSQSGLGDLPQALRTGMTLPYVKGPQFVQTLRSQGAHVAVDGAFDNPPDTTVEAIDAQLYLNGFEPQDVAGLAGPGPAWSESTSLTFGAADVAVMQPATRALRGQLPVASQWRGGKIRVWRTDDQLAVGVTTTFAGEAASAFCDRVTAWYRQQAQAQSAGENAFESDRDAMAVACGNSEVRFAIAPSVDDARAVIGG
jgi:hypothetical protein